MKLLKKSEIINRYGQPVYYENVYDGDTEFKRYINFIKLTKTKYTIHKIKKLKCVIWYNTSEHVEMVGYYLTIFNEFGEKIYCTFPGLQLPNDEKEITEFLIDSRLIS